MAKIENVNETPVVPTKISTTYAKRIPKRKNANNFYILPKIYLTDMYLSGVELFV